MSRTYYPCLYRFRGDERLLIWFSDDPDGVMVDEQFKIPTFSTIEALRVAFPSLATGNLSREITILHDLDIVESRCQSDQPLEIDCDSFLVAWNLFTDVARSIGHRGDSYLESDKALDTEYQKIFFGNNLPSITPPGKHYTPSFNNGELDAIKRHLILGFDAFVASIYPHLQTANRGIQSDAGSQSSAEA